jgi:hypothetical protein
MLVLMMLIGCAKPPPTSYGPAYDELRSTLEKEGVVALKTTFVMDLEAPALPPPHVATEVEARLSIGDEHLGDPTVIDPSTNPVHAAFMRNDYIGAIRFGGGLVRMGETALEARARIIEFSIGEEMRTTGSGWLDETVADLTKRARVPLLVAGGADSTVPTVDRKSIRGSNELDGRDNLNHPRVAISPLTMAPEANGSRWVLVPYLRNYYVHNGGWFLGQEWGCSGGARVEVMLVVYDRRSGQPAWWQVATATHIQSMKAQPSRAEMDQYLLWAEDEVEEQLQRGFLK